MPDVRPEPVRCPTCGTVMNRHAEKLVLPVDLDEAARADPDLGGFVDDVHACPSCGRTQTRRRPPTP